MQAQTPGWYGKLSMLGDFASRRVDPDWVAGCDRWLSAGLLASRQRLGEHWLPRYLAAPLWRFAWAPGVVDTRWWFGILMPSCDQVGRYYPLVVAAARAQAPCDRFGLDHLELWWDQVARAALATLADGATVDAFEAALHDAPPWPGATPLPPAPDLAAVLPAGGARIAVTAGTPLARLVHGIAAAQLVQQLAGTSVWWAQPAAPAAHAEPGHCTIVRGLPQPESFAELLFAQT